MRSKNSVQGINHTKLHRELFKIQGHQSDVHKSNFFSCYVPTEVRNTATGLAIHTRETMHIFDSGATLHRMGLASLIWKEKHACFLVDNRMFRQPVALWSQTQAQVSTSQSWTLIRGYIWWKFLRQCSRWEDCVRKLGYSFSRLLAVTLRLFPDTNRYHPVKGRLTKASLIEKQWWQMLCWIGWSPSRKAWEKVMHPLRLQRKRVSKRNAKTKLLADSPPSVVTDTGGDTLAKDTKSKEGIFGSRARGCRSVLTHSPKISNVTVCKVTKSTRARCCASQQSASTGTHFALNLETLSQRITQFWTWKASREADTNTLWQKQGKSHRLSEGKKGCKIENWNSYRPSILRKPRKILSGKKNWRTPCWIFWNHLQDWKNERHIPRLRMLEATLRKMSPKRSCSKKNVLQLQTMRRKSSGKRWQK